VRAGRVAAARRGPAAFRAAVAVVRRRVVVARAVVVARVAVRRRAEVVRGVAVRRARVLADLVPVLRRAVERRAVLRPLRGAVAVRPTAASSFFSMSARRFSNAFSWAETVRVRVAAVGAVRVVRRAVVRRAVVLRAAVRLAAGLRVVRVAGRAVVRLVPVRLVVRGMCPTPPSCFGAGFNSALKFRGFPDFVPVVVVAVKWAGSR
jgi:hypothetical protein